LLATFWLGRLLLDRRAGLAAMIILATSVGFMSLGRLAMSDMLLALLSTLAVALGVKLREASARWALPALGAVLGLGFLNKGPIAVLLPGLGLALLAWQRRREAPPKPRALALASALFAVLGFGWFVAIYARLGAEPLVHFFLRENLERFAASTYDSGQPLFFYVGAYLSVGAPWSALFALAAARALRPPDVVVPGAAAARFLLFWLALMLVPLSLSRGKIDYYLLPLYPALSLLVGRYLAVTAWNGVDRAWARVVLLAQAAALVLVLLRPPQVPAEWLPDAVARGTLLAVLAIGVMALLAAALRPAAGRVLAVLAAVVAASWLCVVVFFLPAFSASQPNAEIVKDVARERRYRPDLRMAYCSDPTRVRRDVLLELRLAALAECELWSLAGSREPFLLLVTPAEDASFSVDPRYRRIATYRYLPAQALTFDGLVSLREPGVIMLGANFATSDPEAEIQKKREYRKMLDREPPLPP
jgi:4-amino-4-deoxy-L-arabinose transferase-like glycosyltransferase